MAFALLVVFAHEAPEGGASFVQAEVGVVVGVEDELAGEGGSPFGRAHAADGEGIYGVLVAEGHEPGTRSAGLERRRATTMSRVTPCLKLWGRPRTRRARHRVRRE